MIKDELEISDEVKDELLNLNEDTIEVILAITKDLIGRNGMGMVTSYDIECEIEKNYGK